MEDVYQAYEKYRAPYDVVVMEGATQQMIGSNFMEVNAEVRCAACHGVMMGLGIMIALELSIAQRQQHQQQQAQQ